MAGFKKKVWWFIPDYIDRLRLFPRAFISFYIYMLWLVITWFMGLPDPSISQAGLVSAIVGVGAAWFQIYVSGAPRSTSEDLKKRMEMDSGVLSKEQDDTTHTPPDDYNRE